MSGTVADSVSGAVTAGDGTYTLGGLAPGTYRVTFADPTGDHTQQWHPVAADYPTATPLAVAGGTALDIDAALAG